MRRRLSVVLLTVATALSLLFVLGAPASADHSDPSQPASPTTGTTSAPVTSKGGGWKHVANFPANPGTDLEFFTKNGSVFSSSGTLGQGAQGHVGQRILQLTDAAGKVKPTWQADHGSAACQTNNTGVTSLQHDVQVTPKGDAQLLIDTVDTSGRCHDTAGGGLEFVDISGMGTAGFKPREVHLTRHNGTSHTVTVDDTRPNIVYNSSSEFGGMPWIDVMDIRSCLGNGSLSLDAQREGCRPEVFRIPFQAAWSSQKMPDGTLKQPASCHDITARGSRIYCASLNATLIFDVSGMTNSDGSIKGTPLPCRVVDGTRTTAKVTDCALGGQSANGPAATTAWQAAGSPQAEGWTFLGTINHPGRNDQTGATTTNSNTVVRSDEGAAVSHEADPTPDGKFMFVTDERGGGVVPGGASCATGVDNPYGNGGMHVFDISDPSNPTYALDTEGNKAVFISDEIVTAPTFCSIHVMEQIPGENRMVIAWYSQGIKIVDYAIDSQGRWSFNEVANFSLPSTELWAAEQFKMTDNADGTRTYNFLASDISRGIDVVSWTGKPNPTPVDPGTEPAPCKGKGCPKPPKGDKPPKRGDAGLLALGFALLPAAAAWGRRRR
jgi:hypothetical protein